VTAETVAAGVFALLIYKDELLHFFLVFTVIEGERIRLRSFELSDPDEESSFHRWTLL